MYFFSLSFLVDDNALTMAMNNAMNMLRSERLTGLEKHHNTAPDLLQSRSGRRGFLPVPRTEDSLQRTTPGGGRRGQSSFDVLHEGRFGKRHQRHFPSAVSKLK